MKTLLLLGGAYLLFGGGDSSASTNKAPPPPPPNNTSRDINAVTNTLGALIDLTNTILNRKSGPVTTTV